MKLSKLYTKPNSGSLEEYILLLSEEHFEYRKDAPLISC